MECQGCTVLPQVRQFLLTIDKMLQHHCRPHNPLNSEKYTLCLD
jgi:hypothetical protein